MRYDFIFGNSLHNSVVTGVYIDTVLTDEARYANIAFLSQLNQLS
ncbi:hypothetical protein P4S73_26565 [Paraglaciecola sp. Hal342]